MGRFARAAAGHTDVSPVASEVPMPMTKAVMNANHTRPAPDCHLLPRRSEILCHGVSLVGDWIPKEALSRRAAVTRHPSQRVTGTTADRRPESSLVVGSAHRASCLPVSSPERTHYAPMDAKALDRYSSSTSWASTASNREARAEPSRFCARRRRFYPSRVPRCGSPLKAGSPIRESGLRSCALASGTSPGGWSEGADPDAGPGVSLLGRTASGGSGSVWRTDR